MNLQIAISNFLFHCKIEKQLSDKTIKAYTTDLNQFRQFVLLQKVEQIEIIDKHVLKLYMQHLCKNAPKTIKRKLATAKVFFNFHEFEENIIANPFRKVKSNIKIPFQLPNVMDIRQVGCILEYAYESRNNLTNKLSFAYKERVRNIAVLELLFATGIRVSELCNIKHEDFANRYSAVTVNGKGNKQRVIPITNNFVVEALKECCLLFNSDKGKHFFLNRLGNQLSSQSVRLMVKKYSKGANIKTVTPHVFRHSFATLLLEQDVDIRYIQNILGHSSINTTQIYTHVNSKKKCEILALKHPRNEIGVIHE